MIMREDSVGEKGFSKQNLRWLDYQRLRRFRRKGGNTGEEFIEKRRPSTARFLYLYALDIIVKSSGFTHLDKA